MQTRMLLAGVMVLGLLGAVGPAAQAGSRQSLPNLYVVSLGSAVSSDCTSISVDVFYGNNGEADSGPFAIGFTIDTKGVVRAHAPSVAPGAIEHTKQFPIMWPHPTSGDHTLTVILDPKNLVTESNESDNSLSQTFTCP